MMGSVILETETEVVESVDKNGNEDQVQHTQSDVYMLNMKVMNRMIEFQRNKKNLETTNKTETSLHLLLWNSTKRLVDISTF